MLSPGELDDLFPYEFLLEHEACGLPRLSLGLPELAKLSKCRLPDSGGPGAGRRFTITTASDFPCEEATAGIESRPDNSSSR